MGASASRRHGRASRLTAPTRPPPFTCVLLHGGPWPPARGSPLVGVPHHSWSGQMPLDGGSQGIVYLEGWEAQTFRQHSG